jgi:hypothetical protein
MLLDTMSFKEIKNEIFKDFEANVRDRSIMLMPDYASYIKQKTKKLISAKKRREFRSPKAYRYRSNYNNNWLIIYDKDSLDYLVTYVCFFNTKKSLKAYMIRVPPEKQKLKVITGHFLKRYRERMKLDLVKPIDLLIQYFTKNPVSYIEKVNEPIDKGVFPVYERTTEGVSLGVFNQQIGLATMNTFLSDRELKGDQRELREKVQESLQGKIEEGQRTPEKLTPVQLVTLERMLQKLS